MKPEGPFLSVVPEPGDDDPELEPYFAAARELAEPDARSRARVARGLNAALPPSAPLPAFGSADPARPGRALAGARSAAPWLALGAAGLVGAGFGLGVLVGRGEPPPVTPADARAVAAVVAASGPERLEPTAGPQRALSTGPMQAATAASPPPDANAPPRPQPAPATPRGEPPLGPRARQPAASAAGGLSPPSRASFGFREALEQLRRAREQLERGHATMSLLLLSELDRAAGPLLQEEREATRALALCATGQARAAREVAERLAARNPRSIYAARLAASCIADTAATHGASQPRENETRENERLTPALGSGGAAEPARDALDVAR